MIAFDAPGHGASAGKGCSVSDLIGAVLAVVLLAQLSDPEKYAGRFASICRMPRPVCESMKVRLAARHGVAWEKLRLAVPSPSRPAPLLIFHDRGDSRVPLGDGRAIAASWPGAHLVATRGLGHHKILRSAEVIGGAVSFLLPTQAPAALPVESTAEQIA